MRQRSDAQRLPDCAALEDRVLMSASPLVAPEGAEAGHPELPDHLFAPLSDGESFGDSLSAIPIPAVVLSEDPNNYTLQLDDYFDLAGAAPDEITYTLIANTNDELFEEIVIDPDNAKLTLDIAGDQFGEAILTLRATDAEGASVDNTFQLTVNPYNDRPTTTGFSDLLLSYGATSTVIDLFAAFDDVEDADEDLTYEIVSLSNPDLFDSVTLDSVAGTLTLQYAAGASGSSDILLRATDTEGLSVEMTTAGQDFSVFGWIPELSSPDSPNLFSWGVESHTTLSGWAFWDPGVPLNQNTEFNPNLLRTALDIRFPIGFDKPVVFGIENWDINTELGRDKLAEVLDVATAHRPDLEFGYYRLMPERNWWAPVGYQRGLNQIANGNPDGWWARNLDAGNNYRQLFLDWQARNELYRTEEVSASLGGGTLADRIGHVNPSIYAVYRDGDELWADNSVRDWIVYAEYNIAEARKFNVPVNPFITPSVAGLGDVYLEKDFFRQQLDTVFELGDAVTIFEGLGVNHFSAENSGWVEALNEFMDYIRTPTGFTVTVQGQNVPTATDPAPMILPQGVSAGQLDLWSTFHDPDHADSALRFEVVDTLNGDSFSQLEIDQQTGTLAFEFAPGARGYSEVVVRATDPDGWIGDVRFTVALPTLTASSSIVSIGFETPEDVLLQLGNGSVPVPSQILDALDFSDQFEITPNGALTYLPQLDWSGSDSVRYVTAMDEMVELHFEVTAVNDAPVAAPSPTYTFPTFWPSRDINLSNLFTDVDSSLSDLRYTLIGFTGDFVQSVEINNDRQFARVFFVGDVPGTADIHIGVEDDGGGTAVNHFTVVRSLSSLTAPDQNGPALDLGSTFDEDEVPRHHDPQHLLAASGMLTKTQANEEVELADDEDDELVAVPLSLAGAQ